MKEHRSHNKPVLTGALLRRAAALALAAQVGGQAGLGRQGSLTTPWLIATQ